MLFGAHMSISGGPGKALQRGASIGCEVVQIFVKNNVQWFGKPPSAADLEEFVRQRARRPFGAIFGHAGYLINLAGPPSGKRDISVQSLIQEIVFAQALELPFLVMHPGAHLGSGVKRGLKQVVAGLNEVLAATNKSTVRLALENTAGQGSCLGNRIEHLAEIFQSVLAPERLGLCLDTAHFFAAGHDIRAPQGWNKAIGKVERWIGRDQVLAIHLNDSKTDLGSRVDRHEHIGKGKIGLEAFRYIVNDARFNNCPGCLETPKSDDLREDVENLATLRSLARK
jgi:deoxyribonuclease-4